MQFIRIGSLVLLGLALAGTHSGRSSAQGPDAFPRTVTDPSGRRVTVDMPPRVVALIGDAPEVDAVVEPAALRRGDPLADPRAFDWSDVGLLVLSDLYAAISPAWLDEAEARGIPVFLLSETASLDDWRATIEALGQATGREDRSTAALTRLENRLKRLERMEIVEAPPPEMDTASFQLGDVGRSGDIVLNAQNLAMGYDGNPLYRGLSFSLHRGERLGIIGPNGSGKTTLLRQLAGKHAGQGGTVWMGANVSMAFYDQHQEQLNPNTDLLGEMQAFRPEWSTQLVRSYLARFLFSGDDVFKPTTVLSGGERSRLALAKLIASNANLLVLDEPTNHLDMASREALEASLADYEGTLIVVSHDRTFIDKVAERLIIVQDGNARLFYGNFSDWRRKQAEELSGKAQSADKETSEKRQKTVESREQKKAQERETRREQRRIEELENQIASCEAEIETLNSRFATLDPADFQTAQDLKNAYDSARERLNRLYEDWTALAGD